MPFSPGEAIPQSGIYRVMHDPAHVGDHEVTCLYGRHFPSCNECNRPRFALIRGATLYR